jgi:hypothetical protein
MATNHGWFPGNREGQLNRAEVGVSAIQNRGTGRGIAAATPADLAAAYTEARLILQSARSPGRTPRITTGRRRISGIGAEKMRFIPDRSFRSPPLAGEEYPALLLTVPDPARAQKTAGPGRSIGRNGY